MKHNNWLTAGLYIGAIVIGWALAFGGSQYAYRQINIDGMTDLNAPQLQETSSTPKESTKPKKSKPSKPTYISSINQRNIFDSSQAQKAPVVEATPTGTEMNISDIEAQLMGTFVMIPKEFSLATIQANNEIKTYSIGDSLLDAKIELIEPEYVWIRRNGQLEVIQLFGEKKATTSSSATKPKAKSDDSGVEKSGKDKYTVDQAVFDELLQNPEKLYTQIRATEHKKDGEVDGYRVSGIRRKSIFYKLGIKNGDVIHSVNSLPLTNLNEAMKAFESLQSSRDFSFDITRRRKKRTMEYEVR